jgi:hypothetical protein
MQRELKNFLKVSTTRLVHVARLRVFALESNGFADGEYRLVGDVIGFCPANALTRIKSRSHRTKSLVAHMRLSAVDACSFVEARTEIASRLPNAR